MSQDTDKAKRGWYRQTLSIPREVRLVGVTHYPDIADELCLTAICDSCKNHKRQIQLQQNSTRTRNDTMAISIPR